VYVVGSRSRQKGVDSLPETAQHGSRKEVSPACEQTEEKNGVLSCRQAAGGTSSTGDKKEIVCKEQDATSEETLSANLSKNESSATPSLKLGKEIEGIHCKSTNEHNKSVVTSNQNFDGLLGKNFSREKKEEVDNLAARHRGSVSTKDSRHSDSSMSLISLPTKASKPGTDELRQHRRRSLDCNSSHHHRHRHRHHSHHHRDKPDAEQTSRNEEQLVPPLKIRVEHHKKSADRQSTVPTYLVDSRGSETMKDDAKKTSDAKHSEAIHASEPTSHVTDNKTEKDAVPSARETVTEEGDKQATSGQRRTRSSNAMRPVPLVKKRRLTFEESLIAGTCISTTLSSTITTDSVKMSATAASSCSETSNHSKQECVALSPKLSADAKAASVLKTTERKELIPDDTIKIKSEEEKSASARHLSGAKKPSDEAKVEQRFSDAVNIDSNHVKSLSNPVPVQNVFKSSLAESKSATHESKCDPGFSDNNTKCIKSDNSGLARNEAEIKKNTTEACLTTVAKEPTNDSDKHLSSDRTSCHHQRHNRHDHHLRHSGSSVKPHRMTGSRLDFELRRSRHSSSKYGSLIHIETHPNGGASIVHAFDNELSSLSPVELSEFVREFFEIVFDEDPVGVPRYVIGIVHNSAAYLPDILEYFASVQPEMIVKRGHLGKSSDVETTTINEYFQLVRSTYLAGTYRTGPLNHFSIVGTKAEETGGHFPQFLDLLDQNEFLKYVSPWGKISELENMPRNDSNDGPIVWARPGEQVVPTADMPKSPLVKKR